MVRYFGAIVLALFLAFAPCARAKPPASRDLAALLLARTCLREAGWQITDDCAAIHVIVQKRADLESHTYYEQMIARYSRPQASRPWIDELGFSASRPASWPMGLRWEGTHQSAWLELLSHARAIVSGDVVSSCAELADHWGDRRGDRKRALSNGWRLIACGQTRNDFWHVPKAKAGDL